MSETLEPSTAGLPPQPSQSTTLNSFPYSDVFKDVTVNQIALTVFLGILVVDVLRTFGVKAKIPAIGYGFIPLRFVQRWWGAMRFMYDPKLLIDEGYRKFKGGCFRVSTLGREMVIVTTQDKLREFLSAPDDVISAQQAENELLEFKHTIGPYMATTRWHLPLIRLDLTKRMADYIAPMTEEIALNFDMGIGHPTDWTETPIIPVFTRTITTLSNRVFFGDDLAKDPVHIENAMNYTKSVVLSAYMIAPLPAFLRGFVVKMTPVHRRKRIAMTTIGVKIQDRIDALDRGDPVPDDMLTWVVKTAPPGERRTMEAILEIIMFINLGSIHTTNMSTSTVLYQLASDPDNLIPALREEMQEVLGNARGADITKQMLDDLIKMDSFMVEVGRVLPPAPVLVLRVALKEFRFSDGTVIPKGSLVSIPSVSVSGDPEFFDNPELFDPWRFSKQTGSKRIKMVNTGMLNSQFGHGRHACPGRHFAVNEMKLILIELLTRYDIKLIPGTKPKRTVFGAMYLPETNLNILVRKRQV